LRAGYAAYGRVAEGMDLVGAIFATPLDPQKGGAWMKREMIAEPINIISVRRQAP
jgi:peptidyl-prolyl cis-trans isomerase A (cyclophilin A)